MSGNRKREFEDFFRKRKSTKQKELTREISDISDIIELDSDSSSDKFFYYEDVLGINVPENENLFTRKTIDEPLIIDVTLLLNIAGGVYSYDINFEKSDYRETFTGQSVSHSEIVLNNTIFDNDIYDILSSALFDITNNIFIIINSKRWLSKSVNENSNFIRIGWTVTEFDPFDMAVDKHFFVISKKKLIPIIEDATNFFNDILGYGNFKISLTQNRKIKEYRVIEALYL